MNSMPIRGRANARLGRYVMPPVADINYALGFLMELVDEIFLYQK
jgi:hypothetical protein